MSGLPSAHEVGRARHGAKGIARYLAALGEPTDARVAPRAAVRRTGSPGTSIVCVKLIDGLILIDMASAENTTIKEDRAFIGSISALDAQTGDVVWRVETTGNGKARARGVQASAYGRRPRSTPN